MVADALKATATSFSSGAAVAVLMLFAAGCGGSSTPGVASISGTSGRASAKGTWAALYHCFATHGYPNYREIGSPAVPSAPPINGWYRKANGHYVVTPDFMKLYSTDKFRAVARVCDPLGPPPKQMTPAQAARAAAQARKFSRCARAHGVPNFPDPDNQGLINLHTAGLSYESPQFQHAEQACGSLIKNGVGFLGS